MQNRHRIAHTRKLQLQIGNKVMLLTTKEIADLAKISLSHAYRILKDPTTRLTDTVRELLTIKALGQISGWKTD